MYPCSRLVPRDVVHTSIFISFTDRIAAGVGLLVIAGAVAGILYYVCVRKGYWQARKLKLRQKGAVSVSVFLCVCVNGGFTAP